MFCSIMQSHNVCFIDNASWVNNILLEVPILLATITDGDGNITELSHLSQP